VSIDAFTGRDASIKFTTGADFEVVEVFAPQGACIVKFRTAECMPNFTLIAPYMGIFGPKTLKLQQFAHFITRQERLPSMPVKFT